MKEKDFKQGLIVESEFFRVVMLERVKYAFEFKGLVIEIKKESLLKTKVGEIHNFLYSGFVPVADPNERKDLPEELKIKYTIYPTVDKEFIPDLDKTGFINVLQMIMYLDNLGYCYPWFEVYQDGKLIGTADKVIKDYYEYHNSKPTLTESLQAMINAKYGSDPNSASETDVDQP
jgi:hypothetical protein